MHGVEECHDSLAFATEPVIGSLANVLGNYERITAPVSQELKDHDFIEAEIKYGLMQITEALSFLHYSEHKLHRNICPQSILVTRRGCWRLGGMGFLEENKENKDSFPCQPWTVKIPKMAQPDLNYVAPEIQLDKTCNYLSDMFSLGMVICAVYSDGNSLIGAEHTPSQYVRQLDQMHDLFGIIAHKMPLQLVDPVEKMINRDVRYRPTAHVFSTLRYFQDPVVASLQHLDTYDRKDLADKAEAYANLSQVIPNIPRKLLYKNVFPVLCADCKTSENIVYALPALLTMIDFAPRDDYMDIILPQFRSILSSTKPVLATVYILNKLDIILAKTPLDEIRSEVLPMVFNTLDSTSLQAQEAAVAAINGIKEYLDDSIIKKMVLPRAKSLFYRSTNVKLRINALTCIDHMLDSLDKMLILDEILPFLADVSCQDAEVVMTIVGIYKHMLSDKKFGLTHNLIATKVMPSLIPHTVNPGLCMEQFSDLMEVLREMLEQIDRQRRNKMKMETVTLTVPIRGSLKMQGEDGSGDEGITLQVVINEKSTSGKHAGGNVSEILTSNRDVSVTNKRNHSIQSLGMSLDEKTSCTLDKPLDIQRRHSLVPPGTGHPSISITSDDNSPDRPRRPSTHSLGPFSELERRGSRGSIFGTLGLGSDAPFISQRERRPSFQAFGESVMHLFSGK
ncbi:SCY1-like protein 2 [Haliotis rubra]|uniref:SCY1-like protein 2 n=1 Tax=Haliotis rubra TaxID=36100 RepID=UPI001EE52B40|nr:SCY1-like protein 2 [Haliotis rubra]